jgi:hypothetical protein
VLILGGNQLAAGGYEIANSIRYDKTTSQYLRRTCGSSASSYTLSLWAKNCEPQGGDTTAIYWNGAGAKINWEFNGISAIYWYDPETRTTGSYRDVSAWYHLVWKVSSNVGTLYVNGVAAPGLTSVSGIDSLNSGNFIYLGNDAGGYSPQNGYFAEVCFIDGTALDPTSFGEYDEDSGIWKPIDVSGLSFGSNGFYLDFEDSSALGNDVSGNNNDLTSAGFTSLNQSTDTPTNNYATMSPLIPYAGGTATFSNGNLDLNFGGTYGFSFGGFQVSQGKWYWEGKVLSISGSYQGTGFGFQDMENLYQANDSFPANDIYVYGNNGQTRDPTNGVSSYGSSYTTNDIIGIAMDLDNGYGYFSKNGVFQNSGDPTSGASGTGAAFSLNPAATGQFFAPYAADDSSGTSSVSFAMNFGNPTFTISSGNSDANGYGNFEYAVPSGYYALNTKNLAEYG